MGRSSTRASSTGQPTVRMQQGLQFLGTTTRPAVRWRFLCLSACAAMGGCKNDGQPAAGDAGPATSVSAPSSSVSALAVARSGAGELGGILAPGEADKIAAMDASATVQLLGAGAEPREVLRYALAPGHRQRASMEVRITMRAKANDTRAEQAPVPAIRVGFSMDVLPALANAGPFIPVRLTFNDFDVLPTTPEAASMEGPMREQFAALRERTVEFSLDPEGHLRQGVAAPGALDAIQQSIEGLAVPALPASAVGQGAQWRTTMRRKAAGIDTIQQTDWTLVKREGRGMDLSLTQRFAAADGRVVPPGMPPEIELRAMHYEMAGHGTMTVSLDQPSPVKADVRVDNKMQLRVVSAPASLGASNDARWIETSVRSTLSPPTK